MTITIDKDFISRKRAETLPNDKHRESIQSEVSVDENERSTNTQQDDSGNVTNKDNEGQEDATNQGDQQTFTTKRPECEDQIRRIK
jgi:hypothetical protein